LPEISGENETVGRQVSIAYLVAVEERLDAMVGALDLDNPAIGCNSGAPLRVLAAPEKRLLEEAEIGDAVATGGVMEAINFGPQAAAYLIEKVCNGG
jgi:hypothetical protein